jgi:hypothetical protein
VRALIGGTILLIAAITLSLAVARPLLDRVQVDRDAAMALRNASTPAVASPGWYRGSMMNQSACTTSVVPWITTHAVIASRPFSSPRRTCR